MSVCVVYAYYFPKGRMYPCTARTPRSFPAVGQKLGQLQEAWELLMLTLSTLFAWSAPRVGVRMCACVVSAARGRAVPELCATKRCYVQVMCHKLCAKNVYQGGALALWTAEQGFWHITGT